MGVGDSGTLRGALVPGTAIEAVLGIRLDPGVRAPGSRSTDGLGAGPSRFTTAPSTIWTGPRPPETMMLTRSLLFARPFLVALGALVGVDAASARQVEGLGTVQVPPTSEAPTSAGGEQIVPAIAGGDGVYLAAWPDDRSSFDALDSGEGALDVFARRIAADGTPLDDISFRVAGGLGRKQAVEVAWNGSSWLVTWSQVSPTEFYQAQHLFGARVAADGTVLDEDPILIHDFDWYFASPVKYALASNGGDWALAIGVPSSPQPQVQGRIVRADGSVEGAAAPLWTSSSVVGPFDLVPKGTGYLLAVADVGAEGVLLSSELAVLSAPFDLASGGAQLATDGSGFLIVYTTGGPGAQVVARTLSATGVLGTPQTVAPSGFGYAYDPSVTWDGTQYVITYTDGLGAPTSLRSARVTATGTVVDFGGQPLVGGTDAGDARVASVGDGGSVAVWVRGDGVEPYVSDVFSSRVGPTGAADPPQPIANGLPREGDGDLAAGGDGYLAVALSDRDGVPHVVARRLDPFGHALDAEPIVLASGLTLRAPRVAWNGQHFLVVWEDLGDFGFPSFETDDATFGRRLAPDGSFLEAAPFPVLLGGMPDVDAVGTTFLVAASRAVSTQIRRIFVTRVDGAGTVLDTSGVEIGSNFARWPAVASFDDRWLVTWQRNPTHDTPASSVRYAVVLGDGSSLGQVSVSSGSRPGAAASDDVGLVLIAPVIRGLRVGKDGLPLGVVFDVVDSPELTWEPDGAWTGEEFLVAWEDERGAEAFFDDRRDVWGTRISEDGTVSHPGGFPIADGPEHDQMPAVAGANGDGLVAFAKYLPAAPHATVRLAFARDAEWTGIEGGIVGASGLPALAGDGALVGGGALTFDLGGAAPLAPAFFVLGLSRIDLPLFGGVLVPAPDLALPTTTDSQGAAATVQTWPTGLPAGLTLWAQAWITDGAAVQGAAASNALMQTAP